MRIWKTVLAVVLVLGLVIPAGGASAAVLAVQDEVQQITVADRTPQRNTLHILAIGNSFTKDSMRYVCQIAKSAGYDLTVGIMWKGSQALHNQLDYISGDSAVYRYELYEDGNKCRTQKNSRASAVLQDQPWDEILLQQSSYGSAVPASFYDENGNSFLQKLSDILRRKSGNPQMQFGWLTGWAYDKEYTDYQFRMFDNNQMLMYREIVRTLNSTVRASGLFADVIPVGTAIQNLRGSYIGDELNRDGRHLSLDLGRYQAAMTVAAYFGADIGKACVIPKSHGFSAYHLPALRQAAWDAVSNPDSVTQSSYRRTPSVADTAISSLTNGRDCVQLTWDGVGSARSYTIQRRADGGRWTTRRRKLTRNVYTDRSVAHDRKYQYRVLVRYDRYLPCGTAKSESIRFVRTPEIRKKQGGKKSIRLQLSDVGTVKTYEIRFVRRDQAGAENAYQILAVPDRKITLDKLTSGKVYLLEVRCCTVHAGKRYYSCWSPPVTCRAK